MFKYSYGILKLLLFIPIISLGQNLVYNGSFEQYTICPDNGGQINRAKYWFSANDGHGGSSEYFNACDNLGLCGVPSNFWETFQYARTGEAYAGCECYENISEYREYIEGTLKSPLTESINYCVIVYPSLRAENRLG